MTVARWLDQVALPDLPLRAAIVRRAMADIGIEETGVKNRSPYIDALLTAAGTAVGQPWCAAAVRQWYADAGAAVPPHSAASCDVWVAWATQRGCWRPVASGYAPQPGDAVVYGVPGDANHIVVVARTTARGGRSVEGNTSYAGFEREGIAVDFKPITLSRVLGYITPQAAT
jgi:hypothetical protein